MYYLPGSHRSWKWTDLQTHCPLSLSEWISCPHSQSQQILLEQSYQCEPCILSELPTIYMNIACKFEEGKAQIYCNFNQVWYGPMFQKKKETCRTVLSWQVLVKKLSWIDLKITDSHGILYSCFDSHYWPEEFLQGHWLNLI